MLIRISETMAINTQQVIRIYVKKALLYRKAIGETEWDRITVMALKELLEYKKIGLMPQEIKELHKMYAERCEQVNRLTRDNELLKNKDKCKWHI